MKEFLSLCPKKLHCPVPLETLVVGAQYFLQISYSIQGGSEYANHIFKTSYGPGKGRADTKCIRGVTALTLA